MSQESGHSPSDPSRRLSDTTLHQGAIGTLIEGRDFTTFERRAIKKLDPVLASKPEFSAWYASWVTLAGEATEVVASEFLLGPIPRGQGRYLGDSESLYEYERRFIGDEHTSAYNLHQLLKTRNYADASPQLKEELALSIVCLIARTLNQMHASRIEFQRVKMQGIPHLNLKPTNVIVGKRSSSVESGAYYGVWLTDPMIPTSAPLVEQSGVSAPLNYSALPLLEQNDYYQTSADIFSCGLILYFLLENNDFISSFLGREGLIRHHKQELGGRVQKLKLNYGGQRTWNIIQDALQGGYINISQMQEDIETGLGKSPNEVLKKFFEQEPPPDPVPGPWNRFKEWVKTSNVPLVLASGLIVLGLLVSLFYGYEWWRENQHRKEAQAAVDVVEQKWTALDSLNFLGSEAEDAWNRDIGRLRQELVERSYDQAIGDAAALSATLNEVLIGSRKLMEMIVTEIDSMAEKPDAYPCGETFQDAAYLVTDTLRELLEQRKTESLNAGLDHIRTILNQASDANNCLDLRCDDAKRGQIDQVLNSVKSRIRPECAASADSLANTAREACARGEVDGVTNALAALQALKQENDCRDCDKLVRDLTPDTSKMTEDCRAEAKQYIQQASDACENNDASGMDNARLSLRNLRTRADCIQAPCQYQDVYDRLITRLQAIEEDPEDKAKVDTLPIYASLKGNLKQAKSRLDQKDCDGARFSTTSAETEFDALAGLFSSDDNFERCQEYYAQNKFSLACAACSQVMGPNRGTALKYLVVSMARDQQWTGASGRKLMLDAFEEALKLNGISGTASGENAMAHLGKLLALGWEEGGKNQSQIISTWDDIEKYHVALTFDPSLYNYAKCVVVRSYLELWRQTRSEEYRQRVRGMCRDMIDSGGFPDAGWRAQLEQWKEEVSQN